MSADQALGPHPVHAHRFWRRRLGGRGTGSGRDRAADQGLLEGGKVQLDWNVPRLYWGKDWAKLLMNATLLAADCLPRGGAVTVEAGPIHSRRPFTIRATRPECPRHRGSGPSDQGRGAECGRASRPALPDLQTVAHRECGLDHYADGRRCRTGRGLEVTWTGVKVSQCLPWHGTVSCEFIRGTTVMKHCLVVDDSRVIRTVARRILEDLHLFGGRSRRRHDGAARLPREDARPDLPGLESARP